VSIVVIGVNHKTSPLAFLERVTISPEALAKTLHGLCSRPHIREAVVLSTCNRTEVYAVAEKFHGAYGDIRDFFCELGHLAPDELHPHLYSQHDEAAVSHLFEVAAGLDSAVIGEHEILGQVRSAWKVAQHEQSSRSTLNMLFRHALETGKRARTETGISRATASISYAAVEMAAERLDGLAGRRVLVIGAGEMAVGMAVAIANAGVAEVAVTNRTVAKARDLADKIGARVAPFADMQAAIAEADLVLTSTGSGSILIDHEMITWAMRSRADRPLMIVDVAVPRDVDSAVSRIPDVTLLDLDDLRAWAARGLDKRAAEATVVAGIVRQETERFAVESLARQAAPLIAQLSTYAEAVRAGELDRHSGRLNELTPAQRDAVDAVTKGIVAKLLHSPIVRLKTDAGSPRGERHADAVRELFDLQ
jgi:glutamyl-tRNA reductase